MEFHRSAIEVEFHKSFSAEMEVLLFTTLVPDVEIRVIDGPSVERILGDAAMHVIVAERHIVPLLETQVASRESYRGAIEFRVVARHDVVDVRVDDQHVLTGGGLDAELGNYARDVGHREDGELVVEEREPLGFRRRDTNVECLKERHDAAAL